MKIPINKAPTGTAKSTSLYIAVTDGINVFKANIKLSDILDLSNIPTSDPEVEGDIWNNAGVLTVSAG